MGVLWEPKKIIGISMLLCCLTAHATIYQSTNKNGTIVFSNTPSHNSKPVQLEKLQTYHVGDETNLTTVKKKSQSPNEAYKSIEFINLKNNAIIRNNNSIPFSLQASITPALKKADSAILILDGKQLGKEIVGPSDSLNFNVFNVLRGSHQLQIQIVSSHTQQRIFQSDVLTVNFQQTSSKFKKKG